MKMKLDEIAWRLEVGNQHCVVDPVNRRRSATVLLIWVYVEGPKKFREYLATAIGDASTSGQPPISWSGVGARKVDVLAMMEFPQPLLSAAV